MIAYDDAIAATTAVIANHRSAAAATAVTTVSATASRVCRTCREHAEDRYE